MVASGSQLSLFPRLPMPSLVPIMRVLLPILSLLAALFGAAGGLFAQAPTQVPAGAQFVASSQGRLYYPVGCSAWHTLSARNLVFFRSAQEAESRGLSRTTARECAPVAASAPSRPAAAATAQASREAVQVRSVYDGDTMTLSDGRRLRLVGIDTPEMQQKPAGDQARAVLLRLVPVGSTVYLEYDVQRTDRYQRTLAWVWTADGVLINEAMARAGMAAQLTIAPNVKYAERIGAAVREAREARRGLWATDAFACSPSDHRAGRC
jgi:micrococcal nuclease